jgi:hypothetical protein
MEKMELMPHLFSEDTLDLMKDFKSLFDPTCRLNPGQGAANGKRLSRNQAGAGISSLAVRNLPAVLCVHARHCSESHFPGYYRITFGLFG